MKKLSILLSILLSFNVFSKQIPQNVLRAMDEIEYSVDASGAFRFEPEEVIVKSNLIKKKVNRKEVIKDFLKLLENTAYTNKQKYSVIKSFAKLIGKGPFLRIKSRSSEMYYDTSYTAYIGKDYKFTFVLAWEN